MEESNYRQVGAAKKGKLIKGSLIDGFNRISEPSIPTKYELVLIQTDTKDGFGSKSPRFIPKNSYIPGPGEYKNSSSENTPSLSKKGYGPLTNRSNRFDRTKTTLAPGPGTYEAPIQETHPNPVLPYAAKASVFDIKLSEVPAPGEYDPKEILSIPAATSTFKSKTKRLEFRIHSNPPPGYYDPNYSVTTKSSNTITSSFKRPLHMRRYPVNLYDPHAPPDMENYPGPGKYESDTSYYGKRTTQPSSMFAVSENDRFGTITRPRKCKNNTPGPGAYVTAGSDRDWFDRPKAPFLSDAERTLDFQVPALPGPAYYKPENTKKKKSFHYNINKVWL